MASLSVTQTPSRLAFFPVQLFAVVMGVAGLALALHGAERAFGLNTAASLLVLAAAIVIYLGVLTAYGLKLMRHPEAVAAEWAHPVKIAFFPAASIGLLLIATGLAARVQGLATVLWIVGAAAQGAMTLAVISNWIGGARSYQQAHLNPAWFIPAVGNVVVPVAGATLGFTEISWLFFSAGLVFWAVLLTLVMNRLIFHDPLPGRLLPTLVILIAPPAVAFIAYIRLTGAVDPFAHILLSSGYVFALVVATQVRSLMKLGFALSWWALTFPLAALSVASFLYGGLIGSRIHEVIGALLLVLLICAVGVLGLRTVRGLRDGSLLQPEG